MKEETKMFLIMTILIFYAVLSPFVFTTPFFLDMFRDTGAIGDTIGGLTAPFINLLSALLLYFALKTQIYANSLVQKGLSEKDVKEAGRLIKIRKMILWELEFKILPNSAFIIQEFDIFIKSVSDGNAIGISIGHHDFNIDIYESIAITDLYTAFNQEEFLEVCKLYNRIKVIKDHTLFHLREKMKDQNSLVLDCILHQKLVNGVVEKELKFFLEKHKSDNK